MSVYRLKPLCINLKKILHFHFFGKMFPSMKFGKRITDIVPL